MYHFHNLKRIADHISQRLVHIGDERHDVFAHALAGFNHKFGKKSGILFALHKRAGTGLHVEHQRVNAFRKFLTHDRSADQMRTFDGASHVAQRVEFAISWCDFRRLADHGAATGFQYAAKFRDGKIHVEAGDGLKLVQGSSGMSEAATADHGNRHAGGGRKRRKHQ